MTLKEGSWSNFILFISGALIGIATAIAQVNHVFDGRLWVAWSLYGIAVLLLAAWVLLSRQNRHSVDSGKVPPLMKDSGNATAIATGGAGGHASIGDIVLHLPPAQSATAPAVATEKPEPRIVIEYQWRQDMGEFQTDPHNKPVILRNTGKDEAFNVQIEPITNDAWTASFPAVPHIMAQDKTSVLAFVTFLGRQTPSLANSLISMLKPDTDRAKTESRVTKANVSFTNSRGDHFTGEYEFRWDHVHQECRAFTVRFRKYSASEYDEKLVMDFLESRQQTPHAANVVQVEMIAPNISLSEQDTFDALERLERKGKVTHSTLAAKWGFCYWLRHF